MDEIAGNVIGVLFSNRKTDYYILKVQSSDGERSVVKGSFPGVPISVGISAKFQGRWEEHPTYGRGLMASSCDVVPQRGKNGVVTYLSNYVKSIGPVTAGKLYVAFGDELLQILDNDPEKIRECDVLTPKQADAIIEEWKIASESRTATIFLRDSGLNSSQIKSVYTRFGTDTVRMVRENPYCLYECPGVGFQTSDQVARRLGVGRDDERRVVALTLHTIHDLSFSEGHMYVTSDQVKSHVQKLFRRAGVEAFSHGEYLSDTAYYSALAALSDDEEIVVDNTTIYSIHNWQYETESARYLSDMIKEGPRQLGDLRAFLTSYEERNNITLSDQQREAFFLLEDSRVLAISGYPGTGKTTLVSAFVELFGKLNLHHVLMSPTGIAAKRLSKVTGKSASTIHRALGYKHDGGWDFCSSNKFHADVVIVDEMSMVDGSTFYHLVSALPPTTVLILVGDAAQLPSVGAGHVLNNLLGCPDVPHVSLTRIYRQRDESDIVAVAHQILAGKTIDTTYNPSSQFVFLPFEKDNVLEEVCKLTTAMKAKEANFQVIAPKYDGDLGVNNLNKRLREVLNAEYAAGKAAKLRHGSCDLYEGDRVMVVKNDYDRMVFNGDVGKIQRISVKEDEVEVKIFEWFDHESPTPRYFDKVFTFKIEECRTMLSVAYACTAHKVQGQEFDYVLMPMTMQYGMMLYRNLIYTAITRAKKKVFVFGDPAAFRFSVSNERETVRNSDLGNRVSDFMSGAERSSPRFKAASEESGEQSIDDIDFASPV